MATSRFFSTMVTFSPLQLLHLSYGFMVSPWPWQSPHLPWLWLYIPGPNCTNFVTTPDPLHLVHFVTLLPPFPLQGSQMRDLNENKTTFWFWHFSWLRGRPPPRWLRVPPIWVCLFWGHWVCDLFLQTFRRDLLSHLHQEGLRSWHPPLHSRHKAVSFLGLRWPHRRQKVIWIFLGLLPYQGAF